MIDREAVLERRLRRTLRRAAVYRARLQLVRTEERAKFNLKARTVLESAVFQLMRAMDALSGTPE